MSGELSSDATLLAKGCECESFGSPDPGPGVGERYVYNLYGPDLHSLARR